MIDQMLMEVMSRIHQKNTHNLELWEPNHRGWYVVWGKMLKDFYAP